MTDDSLGPAGRAALVMIEQALSRLPEPPQRGDGGPMEAEVPDERQEPVKRQPEATVFESWIPPLGSYRCFGVPARTCEATVERPGICARCAGALAQQERDAIRAKIEKELPDRFAWAQPLAPELPARIRNWTRVRSEAFPWVNAVTAGRPSGIMCLRGSGGSGKTSAALVIMRQLIAAVDTIATGGPRFVQALDLATLEHSQWQRAEEQARLVDACKSASLLVIDDLGDEVQGGRRAAAHEVIKARYHAAVPTIITTALGAERTKEAAFQCMEAAYDDRIARRILTDGCVIDM